MLRDEQDLGNRHQEPPIQQERLSVPPIDSREKPQEAENTNQERFQGSKIR